MSEEKKGSIENYVAPVTVEQDIDPELRDDRDLPTVEDAVVELPDYDPAQFELPDDYEYVEEGDE